MSTYLLPAWQSDPAAGLPVYTSDGAVAGSVVHARAIYLTARGQPRRHLTVRLLDGRLWLAQCGPGDTLTLAPMAAVTMAAPPTLFGPDAYVSAAQVQPHIPRPIVGPYGEQFAARIYAIAHERRMPYELWWLAWPPQGDGAAVHELSRPTLARARSELAFAGERYRASIAELGSRADSQLVEPVSI